MFAEIIEALVYTFVQTNWMVLNPEKEAIKEIIFLLVLNTQSKTIENAV